MVVAQPLVRKLHKKVRDFPSLIYLRFEKGTGMLAFHGAIPESCKEDITSLINQALSMKTLNKKMFLVRKLDASICDSIEWCDFAMQETKKKSLRQSVSSVHTQEVLSATNCVLSAGGHQDFIECVGIVSDKNMPTGNFILSPAYEEDDTGLYVFKDFCDLNSEHECKNITKTMSRSIFATRSDPKILKASVAYNCKETVNGTSYITVSESASTQKQLHISCSVFKKRHGNYNGDFTRENDWAEISKWNWKTLYGKVKRLPVVTTDFVDKAYENRQYKTVGMEALNKAIKEAPDYKAKNSLIIYNVPPMSKVICIGDIHSNIHGFCDILQKLVESERMNDQFRLRFDTVLLLLGDYGDRGPYGLLVHWLILKLRAANPSRVLVVRGNHETVRLWNNTGMIQEFERMFD